MGSYTDVAGKTILEAWGKFQGYLYAACVVGDLLNRDTSNDGWKLATASLAADAVALENGAAGETIWMALAVVIEAPPTESNGVWSAGVLSAAAICDPLYGAAAGKASLSATGISQRVGFILSTSKAVLCPSTYLTSTTLSLSGDLAVTGDAAIGGTLAVTGATTLTGLLNANGGIKVDTDKFTVSAAGVVTIASTLGVTGLATLTGGASLGSAAPFIMAIKTYTSAGAIVTSGFVGLANTAADMAMTLAAPTAGSLLVIADTSASGTKSLTVKSEGTFDGSNNTLTFDAPSEAVVLFAITTARWVILENIGTVGLSST